MSGRIFYNLIRVMGCWDNKITSMALDRRQNVWINTNNMFAVLQNANKNFSASDLYTIGWEQGIMHELSFPGQLSADNGENIWVNTDDRVIRSHI